jgi:predicted neutral ceramidase superfamily lipid hydrolase
MEVPLSMNGRTSQRERDESPSQRADRNYSELVQELRVAQTGVQILFAFLLSLTFLEGFPRGDRTHAAVLTAALVTSAAATLCFMAPVALHRLTFRQGLKERLVWITHVFSLIGLMLLTAAMDLSLWLVMAVLWSTSTATALALALPVIVLVVWVVLPARLIATDREPEVTE